MPKRDQHHHMTTEQYGDAGNRQEHWPQRVQAVCAFVLVLITGFYAYYARQQVKETQRAIIQTENLAARADRPFVLVKEVSATPNEPIVPGKRATVRIVSVNYGQSPSVQQRLNAKIFVGSGAVSSMERYFTTLPERLTGPVGVFPTGEQATPTRYSDVRSDTIVSAEEHRFMLENDRGFIVAGRIEYEDFPGNFYRADFCFWRLKTGAIAHCLTHNDPRSGQSDD